MRKRSGKTPAVERAFWLAALAESLEEAEVLATRLGPDHPEAGAMLARLHAIRVEVEAMRRGHDEASIDDLDPLWMQLPRRLDPDDES